MTREEILREIDEAMAELRDVKAKVNEALSHARNIVARNGDDEAGYNKCLEDAIRIAKKLYKMPVCELKKIFDRHSHMIDILDNYSCVEILAKLEAYEKEQEAIKVGDVVECWQLIENDWQDDCYGVVTSIYNDSHYEILMQNGDGVQFGRKELKKTGKHIDISSILEQIGGGE